MCERHPAISQGARTGCCSARTASTVVSTNRDKTVTRWDVESATRLETLRGHSNFVQQPVFSPDGETLYTVSHDGTAIAWDLTGDRRLGRPFTFTHDRTFSKTGFDGHPGRLSPDGRLIAVGLKGRGIALWDARKLTPVGAPLLDTGGEVKIARLLTGWANACGRDRRPGWRRSHALGCRLAIAASRAALRRAPVMGARRRLQPGRSDTRDGEQRPRPDNSGTRQPETVSMTPDSVGARATLPSALTVR